MRKTKLLFLVILLSPAMIFAQVPAADNLTGSPNTNMNWIVTTGYDASGNVLSQGKKFFDQSGQLLQVQEKVFYRSNASTVYTHVLAVQPVKDAYGREVLVTLHAPIDYADFNYAPNFIQAPDLSNYTYKNFDQYNPSGTQTDKTNSPDQVGSQTIKGTLGWYYGPNNNWEPYAPSTNFPYTRQSIYKDGTNAVKKQANSGEAFIMGSNHETSNYITPVVGEFTHYLQVRNKFFTGAQVGALAPNLNHNAVITIGKDQNGSEIFKMLDNSGKVLMTARPGTDITLTSNVAIVSPSSASYSALIQGTDNLFVNPSTTQITVYAGSTLFYSGPASGFTVSSLSSQSGTVYCAQPFTYQNCPSTGCGTIMYAALPPSMTYFKILTDNTSVSITGGGYVLYDMNTEGITSLINGNSLNRGCYKVIDTSGTVNITYSNSFTDVSYYFYNQLGQLIATIAPNGVKQLYGSGINNFSTLASVPFVSTYYYDTRGRLDSLTDPDGGSSQLVYSMDGKIRFSQNALQATNGSYSYTNYDQYGRPLESGQYLPDASGIVFKSAAMTAILENTSGTGGLTTGTKTDVVVNFYDLPDNTHNQSGYTQDAANLAGAISTSKRYSSIVNNTPNPSNLVSQSWYNYDEEGKLLWKIKYNPALGANGFKTWDRTYDALSRLTKQVFQKNVAAEIFVHYYQYDAANGNLLYVFTNTVDNPATETMQAKYIYYLHGGLKRVELATNLQGIDYTYTIHGALKAINNSNKNADPGGDGAANGFSPDMYGMVLDYYSGDYINRSGTALIDGVNTSSLTTDSYAGNIKAMSWYSEKPGGLGLSDAPLTYVYNYDPKYQFLASTWGTGLNFATNPASFTTTSFNKESITVPNTGTPGTPAYDANGNILNLQRTNSTGTLTDQFAYNYPSNNNKLQSVVNSATGTPVTYASYTYDALGRETSENLGSPSLNKYIQYNNTGQVTLVARDAAFTQIVVQYLYDETGNRFEKLSYNTSFQLSQVTYYYGDVIYTQSVTNGIYGTLTPQEYQMQGLTGRLGVYYKPSNIYAYELTDHLGNVRAVVAFNAGTCQVRMFNDYYPYGMVLQYGGTDDYRYDYQGQNSEKDGETSWNNFELRMYNSRIARWFTIDPKGQYWSPYLAMGNDPVNLTDRNGGSAHDDAQAFAILQGNDATAYESVNGIWLVNYTLDGSFHCHEFLPSPFELPNVVADPIGPYIQMNALDKAKELAQKGFEKLAVSKSLSAGLRAGAAEVANTLDAADLSMVDYALQKADGKIPALFDPTGLSGMIARQYAQESDQLALEVALNQAMQNHTVAGLGVMISSNSHREDVSLHGTFLSDAGIRQITKSQTLNLDGVEHKTGMVEFTDDYPRSDGTDYNNFVLYNEKGNYLIITLKLR